MIKVVISAGFVIVAISVTVTVGIVWSIYAEQKALESALLAVARSARRQLSALQPARAKLGLSKMSAETISSLMEFPNTFGISGKR